MLRKYHRFMVSATLLVGGVWVLALILLLSQPQSTPETAVTSMEVLPSEVSPTAIVLPKTPLPVPSPVAPETHPPAIVSQPNTVSLNSSSLEQAPITPVPPQNFLSSKPVAIPLPEEPVANQVMVQFVEGTTAEQKAVYIQSIGGQVSQNIDALNTLVVRVPNSQKALSTSPILKMSEPDYYAVAQVEPANDPYFIDQWNLPIIHAPEGWAALPANPQDIVVAVLDSGICADNVDLVGRVTSGWDFVQDDAAPQDEFGHGCSVAGVIAANGNNSAGIAGVAPNVKIMPIRVLDAQGIGTYSRVAAGITYAVDHGASIINLSLGGLSTSSVLQSAIDYAVAHHVMVIAAAGNTGNQTLLFPASYEPVIAVGSVNRNLQPSSFSSTGVGIDLYAPGEGIVSTSLDGFSSLSGTSLASPQVAGVAALDMALGQTLKVDGGIVSVTGFAAASPTSTPPPSATDTVDCNKSLANEAEAALSEAIHQRSLGNASDDDVHNAGQAYLDAAAGCFDAAYKGGFSIDDGGTNLNGEVTDQFVFNNSKWGAASTGAAGNPPGVPGGTVTYSFMPDGVDLSPGLPYEEGAVKQGDVVEALSSLPGNTQTCNLEARVEQVFAVWSAIANIDFVRVADNGAPFNSANGNVGDIRIGGHSIDGVGEQLAHAFFPPSAKDSESGSGDLHFDAAENWGCAPGTDAEGRQVVDVGLVALHEVGHAIGLNHEQVSNALAVMNPTYNSAFVGTNGPALQPDDITGAKAIYGVRGFDAPAGLSPLNITQDNTPTFSWTAVASATQYQLQVSVGNTYENPLLDQIIGPDASSTNVPAQFTLITPLVNGNYVWRVRAFNQAAGGWGAWSTNTLFTMRIGVPALLSPLNGETVRAGQITFQWTTVFGDDPKFDWQIAKLPDFASINLIKSVTDIAQPVYTINLTEDGTYYWRARANGGDWSTVRSFSIASNAPVPLYPTGGITLTTNQVTFEWTPIPGATEYQYQIDTSPNFVGLLFLDNLFLNKLFLNKLFLNKLFLNKLSEDPLFLNKLFGDDLFLNKLFSDPLFLNKLFLNKLLLDKLFLNKLFLNKLELGKPLSEGIHYWRVRAHLADGTWGEWSSPANFIVDTPRSNVVINEVQTGDPAWIELYNSGTTPVDLSTWQFIVYLPDGEATFAYSFPDGFVIQPGAYVTLHEANGTDTATDLYMGPNTIDWVIPDVGALSTDNTQAESSSIDLAPKSTPSDSASETPTVTVPTEESVVIDTAATDPSASSDSNVTSQSAGVNITPSVNADEASVSAQSASSTNENAAGTQSPSSTDEGAVTAQGIYTINIGDTVNAAYPGGGSGTIETAAGNDVYTFTATAGQIAYFDGLSGSGITWRLVNPSSTQVFSQSITSDGGRQVLVAGTYTLTVTANAGVTGAYSFAIRTVAAPQTFTINVGDTVSNNFPGAGAGNIETPGAQDIYTFTGTAGQIVYFDGISATDSLYWTLTSPANPTSTTIFDRYYVASDWGRQVLPSTGTYMITVSAYGPTYDDNGTYSFKLWNVPAPQTFAINVGDTVSNDSPGAGAGNIESPGAQDIYTFSGTAGQNLYFDGISATDSLYWTLTGPTSSIIFNRYSLQNSYGALQTLTATGTYTITVGAYGSTYDDTGTYSFKILTAPATQTFPIAIDDTVSDGQPSAGAGNLEGPGAQDVYTFTGTAGQTLYFDAISATDSINWSLTTPTGTAIFDNYDLEYNDGGQQTLTATGTYTITVQSNLYGYTGTYSFKIWTVAPPQNFSIAIGDTVSDGVPGAGAGNIETPGAQDIYTFTGTAGQVLYFDAISASNSLYWTLTSPTSSTIFNNYNLQYSNGGQQVLPASGTYTIKVNGSSSGNIGTYSFKIWTVPAPQTFPIAVGDTVSNGVPGAGAGNLESPGAQDIYTFSGTAGQELFFDATSSSASYEIYWSLISPSTSTIFNTAITSDGGQRTLSETGTYSIKVYDGYGNGITGSYSFKILTVPAPQTFSIAVDDTVSDGVPGAGAGNLESPGAQDIYTFSGTTGQKIYFDAITSSSSYEMYWTLTSPSSVQLFKTYINSDGGSFTLSETGTYTITVSPYSTTSAVTGTYSFKLWTVTAPQTFSIAVGDTVSDGVPGAGAGNIESPGTQDTYTFSGTTGQSIFFDGISSTGTLYWTLTSPSSVQLFNTNVTSDGGQRTLSETGTYTIKVYDAYEDGTTGTYSFKLWTVTPPQNFTIAVGDTVSDGVPGVGAGNLESPSTQDIYTFAGTAGQKVFFDGLASSTNYSIYWTLTSPSGVQIFNTYVNSDGGQFTLSETGNYTITVASSTYSPVIGTYSFKLWNVPAAQTFNIAVGDTVSDGKPGAGAGNLESPAARDIYTFAGTAGQTIFFDGISNSSNYQIYWTLTSPSSVTLFNTYAYANGGKLTLTETGNYTITVAASSSYVDTTGTYGFKLWTVPASQNFNIAVGDTVADGVPAAGAGNLESPGAQDTYTFSATTGQSIFFDGIASSATFGVYWTLTSPSGVALFNTAVNSNGGQLTLTETGTYTIKVYDYYLSDYYNSGNTGSYSFRISLTSSTEFAIALGSTVSNGSPTTGAGNISSAGEVDTYVFGAQAGQNINLIAQTGTSTDLSWQLTAPNSTEIFNTGYANQNNVALPVSGTYKLIIQASTSNPSFTGNYGFQLIPIVAPQTFAINIGDTISNGIPAVGAGNLELYGSQDIYTFTGTAGQTVFFDPVVDNTYDGYWKLTSPSAATLFDSYFTTGSSKWQVLSATGTYTLTFSDHSNRTGTYAFRLRDASTAQTYPISIGSTVSVNVPSAGAGIITTPGEQDIYTFTATAGQTVSFDGITNNQSSSYTSWRLTAPNNATIFDQSMTTRNLPRVLTQAGTYTLTVYTYYGFTGTYGFKLWNAAAPQTFAVNVGNTVSNGTPALGAGNIETTGSQDIYTFNATAGQVVHFDILSSTNSSIYWRLTSPTNSQIFDISTNSSAGRRILTAAGTYTLTVYGTSNNTGTYSFKLRSGSAPQTFAINIGNTVSNGVPGVGAGNIETTGGEDAYTFNVTSGQKLYFEPLSDNPAALMWELHDPNDSITFKQSTINSYGSTTFYTSGTYTLYVYGSNGETGTYGFKIWEVPAPQTFTINIGDVVSKDIPAVGAGSLEAPGSEDVYSFTLANSQTLYFDSISSLNYNFYWRLTNASGSYIFDTYMSTDAGQYTLASGTYTLRVYSYSNYRGNYSFRITPNSGDFVIAIGDTVSNGSPATGAGNIETAGNADIYAFVGTQGQYVTFDVLTGSSSNLQWRLVGPGSSSQFSSSFGDQNGILLSTTGTYTLTVQANTNVPNFTGTYSFKLTENTVPTSYPISIGSTVTQDLPGLGAGIIEKPGNIDTYTFNGAGNQLVNFDAISNNVTGSGNVLTWSLFDHTGTAVPGFSSQNFQDVNVVTLPLTDTYTLKVQTYFGTGTGNYSFRIVNIPRQTFSITVGNTISDGVPQAGAGNLETAGAQDLYTFSGTAGQAVNFDALTNNVNGDTLVWTLTDHTGTAVTGFSTQNFQDINNITLPSTDTYTLKVETNANAGAGTYSFRLSNVLQTNFTINIGDTVSDGVPGAGAGNIESAGNVDTYTFSGTAGQLLYFDMLNSQLGLNGQWEVRDPSNAVLYSNYTNYEFGRQTLPVTGAYTIRFFGNGTTTGTYSFIIRAVTDNSFPIAIGDTVSDGVPGAGAGNIESPGAQDLYTFSGTAGQLLYFDLLSSTTSINAQWEVRDPSGVVLYGNYTAYDLGRQTLPVTGAYTIRFFGVGDATGTYSFIVRTVTDNNSFAIAIGDTVSNGVPGAGAGNIETPGTEDTYTFSGTAGQLLYFDILSSTMSISAQWEVRNPSNTVIYSNYTAYDLGRQTLPVTGTYTIRYFGLGETTGTYSFIIRTVTDNSFPIAVGDTVSNGVPSAGAGNLETPGSQDTYTFSGTAGQTLFFDILSSTMGLNTQWEVRDPSGVVLYTNYTVYDIGNQTLPVTGTYTIRFYGSGDTIGTYSFRVVLATNTDFPIAIGDTVSNGVPLAGAGNLETTGSQDVYTFNGLTGQLVSFDTLTNNVNGGSLIWSLVDHNSAVVSGFATQTFQDVNNITLPANDTYTLRVQTDNGLGTGTYSFQILLSGESAQPGPTYTVNTINAHDDGVCGIIDCSLVEAIIAANAQPNTNTITLGTSQTYTLTTPYLSQSSGLPEITTPVVIQGNGSTIQRVAADSVPFRLFDVLAAGRLTLNNVTLTGGYTEGGGALGNSGGTITLRSSTITGNRSSTAGGAYYGGGTLTVSNSTFSNNSGTVGGAIHSSGVYTITIDATTFSDNTATGGAGALYANVGTSTVIRNSVFNNNTSTQGSAIMSTGATSSLIINDTTISNNTSTDASASGAVDNRVGTVTMTNVTFTGNNAAGLGGAFYNADGGTATIVASTFNSNSAGQDGGAIFSDLNTKIAISSDPKTSKATTFTSNTSTNSVGGAIASARGTVDISDAVFTSNVATAGSGGAISNGTGNTMTLTGVTLTNNTALSGGGAISSAGSLSMDKTTFTGNSLSGTASTGGAILSSGSLTITDSTFMNNAAGSGAAIDQDVANAAISGSTFTTNTASTSGAALLIAGGTTNITNSVFTSNTSTGGSGAAIFSNAGSTVTVNNTLFKQNVANGVTSGSPQGGGAIATLGTLNLNLINFESNQGQNGGALLVLPNATVTITNSAFKGNQATNGGNGGGLYNAQGGVSITNTTFANNTSSGNGGAVSTDSASGLTLTHVTIAGNSVTGGANSSGGLYAAQGTVDIRNSIIANNTPDNCAVGTGTFTVTTSLQFPGPVSCGTATVLDPQLDVLKGSPAFFPLLPDSPAIDSAENTFCTTEDQRGLPRGFNGIGAVNSPAVGDCDIGAFELFNRNLGQAGPQAGTIGGGAALINVLTGEDFVQFGDTNLIPPQGTNWTGSTPELPDTNHTLGRDPSSSDTDDRTDWSQQDPTMGGQNGIKVVINEIFPGAVDAIELYNSSLETVRMDGWKLMTYNADGALEVNYTFSSFSLAPNAYVVLREGSGANDVANLYLNRSISWADWNARGAVALTNGSGGVDFVRFGDSGSVVPQSEDGPSAQATSIIVQPPDGTHWTGVSPISPLPNQSLGRDSESTDVDDGNDWFTQAPSLGLKNPLIRPAVNDDFNDAIVVLRLPFRNTQTTSGTTRADATDPAISCGFNVGHTIWYQYTAQNSGTVRFQTDGSDFNTVMAVYTNTSGGLNQIACDDDSGEGQRSRIDLNMTAGTTYYFMIGGVDYSNGNAVFSGMPPANDDFDDALSISALPFSDSQNTTAAALPVDDPTPNCGVSIGRSVWYKFEAASDTRVVFRTIGSDFDTVLAVYTGTRGSLVQVGCNDDYGLTSISSFSLRTIPGTTYYIMVAGNRGEGGSLVFTADLLPRPANDFFATPKDISDPLPYRDQIDTTGATNEPLDRANLTCGLNVGNTVWYSYTPTTNHVVTFSTTGSSFDTTLAVWTNINQAPIACSDDAPATIYSIVTLNVTANTTYYIMVGGYSNSGGNLVLRAFSPAQPPANDQRTSAIEISPLPFTYTADVTGATSAVDDPTPSCSGIPLGTTVWFHLSPTAAATQLRLQTTGSDYDTVLAVFANVSGTLAEIGCNDDGQGAGQSLLLTNINANTDVYVMVGDFSGTGGNLVFAASTNTINQRPANDVFESATQISTLPYDKVQSTLNATTAPDDPIPTCGTSVGNSVWYSFTAASSGLLRLQTAGSDFDTVLSVYTGTRGSLTEVACDDTSTDKASKVEFTTVAGTTYSVMIAGNGGAEGNLTFHAELIILPANDDFDSATSITLNANHYSATQTTSGSSSAADDPATACNTTTSNTVWYSFTAPAAGTLSLNTEGSDYNTVLAVFSGTRGSLTSVGCDDNSGANLTARLDNIAVIANTTYYIMVGGAFGQTGSLVLDVALLPTPNNDDFANAIQMTSLPYSNTQVTTGATAASDDLAACNAAPAKTVWYSFTSTSTNLLRLGLDGTTFNSVLAVYTGASGSLTQIACQIGGGLDVVTKPDTTYYIMIGGFGGASGTLNIQASEVTLAANDDFANAIDITALPYTNTQNTIGASSASDDPLTCTPSVGKSVWYRYTASADGKLVLDLTGTNFKAVLAVYTGTRGNLVPLNCTLFTGTDINVTSGTTYNFMVSGFEGDGGTLFLSARLAGSITATITPSTTTIPSGGSVTYTVHVTNTSPTDSITLNTLSDTLYSDLNGKGTCVLPQTVALGSFYECSFTTTVTGNVGDARTDTLTASGKDQSNKTVSASANTTVTIVSGTPSIVVANDDTHATNEDSVLTVAAPGILLNDTGSTLTATVITNPAHGTLTLNTDGSFTYTPNANFNGVDSFTYKANDGTSDSNIATVTITVNPVNDNPVSVDDSYNTDEDTTLTISAPAVLTNDTDADGNTLSASLVSNVTHGTLTLNTDGSFTYTPAANFNGADSFTYKANDGTADSNIATVSITVNLINDAPTAVILSPTAGNITADVTGFASVVLNSSGTSDVEDSLGQLSFLWSWTENGTPVTVTAAGTVYNFPVGTYTITLKVTDSGNLSGTQSVVITIVAPAATTYSMGNRVWLDTNNNGSLDGAETGIASVTVNLLDSTGSSTVASAITDANGYYRFDNLAAGNYIVEIAASNFGVGQPLNGLASSTDAPTSAAPNNDIDRDDNGINAPSSSAVRSGTINLGPGASEPIGEADVSDVVSTAPDDRENLTIDFGFAPSNTNTNQPPTVNAGTDASITLPTNSLTLTGTASDDGLPLGSTLTTTWSGPADVTFANPNALSTPATFATPGSYTLTLTASDGAASVSDTVVITVNSAANQPPVITSPGNQSSSEGAVISLQIVASDPENTTLTYAATGLPAGLTINPSTGLISGTLPFTVAGNYVVNLSVTDSGTPHLTASTTFNWSVADVPQAGTAVVSFTLLNADTNLPIAGFDPLLTGSVINLATLPTTHVSVRANVSGTPVGSVVFGGTAGTIVDNTVPYALGNTSGSAALGSYTLIATPFSLTNGRGTPGQTLSVSFSVINQTAPNNPPVLGDGQATVNVNEGQTAVNSGSLSDADNDPLTLTASVGIVTRSGNTWNWSYVTTDGPANSQTMTISVSDGHGGTAQKTFALTVANVAPTAVFSNSTGPIVAGSSAILTFTGVSDPSIVDMSAVFAYRIDCTSDGIIDFNAPVASQACSYPTAGSFTATGSIIDKDGGIATYTTSVTVSPVTTNNPPVITPPGNQNSSEGAVISLQIVASDPENTPLTYAATGLPAGLSINPTTGLISGTLPFTAAGNYVVNLSVTDSGTPALTASTTFNWSVADVPQIGTAVVSFTLLNSDTNLPIAGYDPLLTGTVINLATLPTSHINVRANVSGAPIGSVVFGGSAGTIIDNTAPYALFGSNIGSTYVGSYTLSATPFSLVNGGGTAGQTLSISFSVINQAAPPTAAPPAALAVVTPPVAAFKADLVAGVAPLTVQFTNQSTGDNLTYAWDFGDSGISSEGSPSHIFAAAGSYTVTLTVSNAAGSNSTQIVIQVTPPAETPTLDTPAP